MDDRRRSRSRDRGYRERDRGYDRERDRDSYRDRDRDRERDSFRDRDRDRNRDRDRDRDRERDRDRDRDRERRRSRSKEKPPAPQQEQPDAAAEEAAREERRKKKKSSNWDAAPDQVTVGENGEIPSSTNPQLTFKARRIYVGNLPQTEPPVGDVVLREFIDQAMHQAGLTQSTGCCVSDVWISSEKHFAFVEVRTVQEANNAMSLDGITFYGQPLRINRPHDYVPPAPDSIIQQAGMVGGGLAANLGTLMQNTKKARRVHVGNLPVGVGLSPASLKKFISDAMQQLSLTVKPGDPCIDSFLAGDGKFGFVEMRTVAEANNALAMTGIDCYGRPLRVGRPADYVPLTGDLIQQCEGTGILGTPGDAGVTMFGDGSGTAAVPASTVDMSNATKIVMIKNMMSETELNDDGECAEIAEDTKMKCEEDFGKVISLVIARPGREGVDPDHIGRCFVEFEDIESAKKAADGLDQVKFDDRTVETGFEEPIIFDQIKAAYPEQNPK